MEAAEAITFIWLVLLSLSVVALYGAMQARYLRLQERLVELRVSEQLQLILSRVDRDLVQRNSAMREGIEEAVRIIEDNSMLVDKYWSHVQRLKQLLK